MRAPFIVTLLLLNLSLYPYDFLDKEKSMVDFVDSYEVYGHELYFVQEFERVYKIPPEQIRLTDEGYYVISREERREILIPGERSFNNFYVDYYKSEEYVEEYKRKFPLFYEFPASTNIESITSSSSLTERINGRLIEYSPENLMKRYVADCTCHPFTYNTMAPPWAEGVPGPGIGETLTVEFEEPSDFVTILNGYVDPSKTHLFKQNGRLKDIRVSSANPSFELFYTFDDYAYYADIEFPGKTGSITIEIRDVYGGTKYEDTCISGIIGEGKNVSSRLSEKVLGYGE